MSKVLYVVHKIYVKYIKTYVYIKRRTHLYPIISLGPLGVVCGMKHCNIMQLMVIFVQLIMRIFNFSKLHVRINNY
jgi:hypothetical protein